VRYAYIWDKGRDTIQALPVLPPSSSKVGFAISEVDGGVQIEFDKFVVLVEAFVAAGNERFHEHDIRGKVATNIDDPLAAQKLLGHQGIKMTEDYIKQRKADEVMPHRRKQCT